MTPEQWEIARRSHDAACAERDRLRALLNRARLELAADSPLHPEIRQALGLVALDQTA